MLATTVSFASSTWHSKARIIESIQTETSGSPGVPLAGIQSQYKACLVVKSCEAFSDLNMFPPLAKAHPPKLGAWRARDRFIRCGGGDLCRGLKDSHSLEFRFSRQSE